MVVSYSRLDWASIIQVYKVNCNLSKHLPIWSTVLTKRVRVAWMIHVQGWSLCDWNIIAGENEKEQLIPPVRSCVVVLNITGHVWFHRKTLGWMVWLQDDALDPFHVSRLERSGGPLAIKPIHGCFRSKTMSQILLETTKTPRLRVFSRKIHLYSTIPIQTDCLIVLGKIG